MKTTILCFLIALLGFTLTVQYLGKELKADPKIRRYVRVDSGEQDAVNKFLKDRPECDLIEITRFCGIRHDAWYLCVEGK